MRLVGLLFILLLLSACGEQINSEEGDTDRQDILIEDMWMLNATEKSQDLITNGIKFSKNKKIFYFDSQGRVIPTFHDIGYEIEEDTLRIVDFKYEQQFLFEKGTRIFLIESMNDDELILEMVHPEENKYYFDHKSL
ncbi:MAG: hypothetical protein ACQERC_11275 [Bacteroidota bacterium]